jgi:hypothetical protein
MVNNDALVAALGSDAVAAAHGYRLEVISEAERRGLRVVSDRLTGVVRLATGVCLVIDPIDIRLTVRPGPVRADLDGLLLRWGPGLGWSRCGAAGQPGLRFFAGPDADPIRLVPTAAEVLDWMLTPPDRQNADQWIPPTGVELDDDPAAIERLRGFIDPEHRLGLPEAFSLPEPSPAPPSARHGSAP